MDVNLHERRFPASSEQVGRFVDTVALEEGIWPSPSWPAMHFKDGLRVGSGGGHGPVRYRVDEYVPGERVRFRFLAPRGFVGWHELAVFTGSEGSGLRHTLKIQPRGLIRVTWPLVFRPMHNALIEDAFDNAAVAVGSDGARTRWSWWVRFLRRLLKPRG